MAPRWSEPFRLDPGRVVAEGHEVAGDASTRRVGPQTKASGRSPGRQPTSSSMTASIRRA